MVELVESQLGKQTKKKSLKMDEWMSDYESLEEILLNKEHIEEGSFGVLLVDYLKDERNKQSYINSPGFYSQQY